MVSYWSAKVIPDSEFKVYKTSIAAAGVLRVVPS